MRGSITINLETSTVEIDAGLTTAEEFLAVGHVLANIRDALPFLHAVSGAYPKPGPEYALAEVACEWAEGMAGISLPPTDRALFDAVQRYKESPDAAH